MNVIKEQSLEESVVKSRRTIRSGSSLVMDSDKDFMLTTRSVDKKMSPLGEKEGVNIFVNNLYIMSNRDE